MKESGVGYGSINHPVDRDPVCGYTELSATSARAAIAPRLTAKANSSAFRRITGYLVGTLDSFNDASSPRSTTE